MPPPVDVVPPLSKAFRYSSATDLRCSSVMVCVVIAMSAPPFLPSGGGGVPDLAAQADQVLLPVGGGEDVVFHPGDERLPVAGDPVPRLVEGVVPNRVVVGVGRVRPARDRRHRAHHPGGEDDRPRARLEPVDDLLDGDDGTAGGEEGPLLGPRGPPQPPRAGPGPPLGGG